jgi:hypothetical protein
MKIAVILLTFILLQGFAFATVNDNQSIHSTSIDSTKNKAEYTGNIRAGILLSADEAPRNKFKIDFVNYVCINDVFHIGGSVGTRNLIDDAAIFLPIQGEVLFKFKGKKANPFIAGSAGYSFDISSSYADDVGNILGFSLGLIMKSSSKIAVQVSIEYERQTMATLNGYNGENIIYSDEYWQSIGISLGIVF